MSNQKDSYKEEIDRATAVFKTNMGTFEAELYAKECPETVWNFINLVEGRQDTARGGNYYDGLGFGVLREEWHAQFPEGFQRGEP